VSDVRLIDPAIDPRWDEFVLAHPFGWVTHLSGWKTAIESTFNHMHARYLVLYGRRGEISAALPLFEVKSRVTGNRLVCLPFATLCDPLVSSRQQAEVLLDAGCDMLKEVNASYIEMRTHGSGPLMPDQRLGSNTLYRNHYLRLEAPLEGLMQSFHRSCVRQRIARAIKSGLQIRMGAHESDLAEFYELHRSTRKRLGLPAPPRSLLRALWHTFFPSGHLSLLLSKYEDRMVGGVIVFKFRDRVSGEFLGWDERFRDVSPTHHLFWEAIKMASREGRKIFDFGRSSSADTSLMTFKDRWGTSAKDLPSFYYPPYYSNRASEQKRSFKYRLVRGMCRTLPDPAFRLLGSFCYRHMS
jgi:serine/alanine adding enzyme